MPDPKDAMIGILGASGTLAGLLLIFSGFLFSDALSYPSSTADTIIQKVKKSAQLAVFPFCGFLLTTILSTLWLVYPNHFLYCFCVIVFLLDVVASGIYGTWASYRD